MKLRKTIIIRRIKLISGIIFLLCFFLPLSQCHRKAQPMMFKQLPQDVSVDSNNIVNDPELLKQTGKLIPYKLVVMTEPITFILPVIFSLPLLFAMINFRNKKLNAIKLVFEFLVVAFILYYVHLMSIGFYSVMIGGIISLISLPMTLLMILFEGLNIRKQSVQNVTT